MSKDILKDIIAGVKKNVKGVHAALMTDSDLSGSKKWIKTPSLDLNRILSGSLDKGITTKNLVGIVGPEHTMKSSFMVLCMAEALRQGFTPIIIDTEGGVDNDFCRRWGLDPDETGYFYTPWVDKIKTILAQIKGSNKTNLIIGLDSAGGIDNFKSYSDALGDDVKADQGQLQKRIRSLLKLFLNITIEQDSIGIITGHMYSSPQMFTPDQIGGGAAMRLFPSILIKLKREQIKDGEDVIGTSIKARTIKNRLYPPYQEAIIDIDYKKGIDEYAGILPLAVKAGIVERSGAWYSYKGERLGQGIKDATQNMKEYPALINELNEWLKTTGYSTVNENIRQAEELLISSSDEKIKDEKVEEKSVKISRRKKNKEV
jgi:recombination protein RecA